jgi:hydrophobic/amphiphilic exporter-1 (mainly G- bacteria), HAE1 family
MPESDESRLSATIELTTGLRVEETMKVARELEEIIRERYSRGAGHGSFLRFR